jgi:arsenate reductase
LKKEKPNQVSEKKKILFICTHNSARSQMAEGIMKSLYGEYYDVYSASTDPSEVNPYAIQVMKEIGLDISKQRSKSLEEFRDFRFDYVITVCDQAKESCPFFPGGVIIHKGFKDPSQSSGTEDEILASFRKTRDEIKIWIKEAFKDKDRRGQIRQDIGKINRSHFF